MGVNTQGTMNPEVRLNQIVSILENKFNVTAKVEKTQSENYYTVYFNYNNESRMLSVFENYTDKSHTNKEKCTLVDLNYWGSSVELIRGIVEEFGGEMVESDSRDEWTKVKKIESKESEQVVNKFKIILMFNDGKEIESILLDKRPTEDEIKQGAELYKADSYRVETVTI